MAFSDFKSIEQVIKQYPIIVQTEIIFPSNLKFDLPEDFVKNLDFILPRMKSDADEAFLCEALIFPYLSLIWKYHPMLNLWSHHTLYYDEVLNGKPDYFLSYLLKENTFEMMTPPFLSVAEAKKDNFTEGWGQCLAEMIACQKINDNNEIVIYGIVTTGRLWEFGKLQGDTFIKHHIPYSIDHPGLGGILDYVFTECEKQSR